MIWLYDQPSVALKPYYIALKHYIYAALYRFHLYSTDFTRNQYYSTDLPICSDFPEIRTPEYRNFNLMQRHSRYVKINRDSLTIIHDKDPNDRLASRLLSSSQEIARKTDIDDSVYSIPKPTNCIAYSTYYSSTHRLYTLPYSCVW